MFAVRARELAKVRPAPAVDRYLKRGARRQARDEAGHDGDAHSAMDVGQLEVRDDMASNLEFLEGYFRVAACWEEDNIPVVVAHPSGQCWFGATAEWDGVLRLLDENGKVRQEERE